MASDIHAVENYFEIDITGLLNRADTLSVDLYIRLGGHFTKICNKNEKIDVPRFANYFKKGVKTLFIHNSEKHSYYFASHQFIQGLISKPEIVSQESLRAITELAEQAYNDLRTEKLFDKDMLEKAFNVTSNCLRQLSADPKAIRHIIGLCRVDNYLGMHSVATAVVANILAQAIESTQEPFLHQLTLACLFHDVGLGKLPVEISDPIRNLTGDEFTSMKQHLEHGESLLKAEPGFEARILTAITQHHENFDGSGYPLGLKGEDISQMGRLLALADNFSALNTSRGPSPRLASGNEALKMIKDEAERFDPKLINALFYASGKKAS